MHTAMEIKKFDNHDSGSGENEYMTKRIIIATTMLMLFAFGSLAAPSTIDGPKIDGKWSGQIPRPNHSYDSVFDFKVSGEKLTGTVRSSELDQEFEINEGKIKDDTISFKIGSTSGTYTGKIAGDEIAMKAHLKGGEFGDIVMDFKLKRIKE